MSKYDESECWECGNEIKGDFWIPTICDEEINNLMKFCKKKCAKIFIEKNLGYDKLDY